jgi:zinc D-Ala-D-Ala carboxypeptidase|tara:strand:+ start:1475 stop:1945 length:471 start_codon:yes stop_codon:yes gene_type:complete
MISEHISEKEATKSVTALRLGIDNTPNGNALGNMKLLAHWLFEPLREWVGGPIKITSFYRSPELCIAIGSKTSSQHTCKNGAAIDIDDVYGYKTNAEMFYYIKEHLDFDQMIWEFGNEENPDWLHISYVSESKNRNKILKAVRHDGKIKYIDITNA